MNVQVHDVPFDELPKHFQHIPLVAYKPWIVLDVLSSVSKGSTVLWLDSNTEVRRPLDDVWGFVEEDGYFFTVAGHKFPTFRTVRSRTMEIVGCEGGELVAERTSAIMGFRVDDLKVENVGVTVLEKMHACALDIACHYPPGSTFSNQKRDQSGLNAVLCHLRETVGVDLKCHEDGVYWAYASQLGLRVTEDETMFNDVVFMSRRGVPPMKYIRHIKPEPPEVVFTGENVDTHWK